MLNDAANGFYTTASGIITTPTATLPDLVATAGSIAGIEYYVLQKVGTSGSQKRSTDPAPAGGSYASGAPNIAAPMNALGTFVLVAR